MLKYCQILLDFTYSLCRLYDCKIHCSCHPLKVCKMELIKISDLQQKYELQSYLAIKITHFTGLVYVELLPRAHMLSLQSELSYAVGKC